LKIIGVYNLTELYKPKQASYETNSKFILFTYNNFNKWKMMATVRCPDQDDLNMWSFEDEKMSSFFRELVGILWRV